MKDKMIFIYHFDLQLQLIKKLREGYMIIRGFIYMHKILIRI